MISKLIGILGLSLVLSASVYAQDNYKLGVLLVTPKAGVTNNMLSKSLANAGVSFSRKIDRLNVLEVSVPKGRETSVLRAIKSNRLVKNVELDGLESPTYTPNDPFYYRGWHLPLIQANLAWQYSEGVNVTVAVADSGVFPTHPDLIGKILPGKNVVDGTNNSSDINGHGTWVSGVVAAYTDNGIGVASVAGKALILPIRITNAADGWAYHSDMAKAITFAADNGAKVVNLSYGGGGNATVIRSAASYMVSKGGMVVFSAGNSNIDHGYYDNPDIVIVSATTSTDTKASFSSFGNYVDVSAPGVGIYSTTNGGGYNSVSGTSFSAPIVSGIIANIFSLNPNILPHQVDNILKTTAVDLGEPGKDIYFGHGRVDALEAILAAKTLLETDTQAPVVTIVSDLQNISGIVEILVNATDNVGVSKVQLFVEDILVGEETLSPYSFILDSRNYTDGVYRVKAVATDTTGNVSVYETTTSIKNTVNQDNTPPAINITSPSTNFSITNKNIKIVVNVADESATSTALYINDVLVGTYTTKSIQYTWNVRRLPSGSYTIKVISTDASNNIAISSVIGYKTNALKR